MRKGNARALSISRKGYFYKTAWKIGTISRIITKENFIFLPVWNDQKGNYILVRLGTSRWASCYSWSFTEINSAMLNSFPSLSFSENSMVLVTGIWGNAMKKFTTLVYYTFSSNARQSLWRYLVLSCMADNNDVLISMDSVMLKAIY